MIVIAINVHIRRTADGVERVYETTHYGGSDFWIWDEGNYGCDCNRALFFKRAVNEQEDDDDDDDDDETECGDSAYSVRITGPDGSVLYEDAR